jgi:uncharacterized membrane protein YhaH (DUF805 family)
MTIGRLGRRAFAVSMLLSYSIIVLLALLNAPLGFIMTFVCVNFVWMLLVYTGRLHDVGYSGWWSILVMFTSLLGLIALAAWPGSKDANNYGEVPPASISHLLRFWRSPKLV